MLNIIGGVYREKCLKPSWDHVFGSGGRAALAIANMGTKVNLHAYISDNLFSDYKYKTALYKEDDFIVSRLYSEHDVCFNYSHGLDPLNPPLVPKKENIALKVDHALVFGMLECDFVVEADYAVYDPQNTFSTQPFAKHGSRANHLALVLNENEARTLYGSRDLSNINDIIDKLHTQELAEVIVVKCGPAGAIVSYEDKKINIPAFKTNNVWKIGSGDCFSAHFANNWITQRNRPEVAAHKASLATAFYCESSVLPAPHTLCNFKPVPIIFNESISKPIVYLASPFFTLAQLWLVEQIRYNLIEMGLEVFSPYHDIGLISDDDVQNFSSISNLDITEIKRADLIFGVIDGHDPGTIFELGYATAINKKIILFSENVNAGDLVMFHNEQTLIINDYVTAIYQTLWVNL